MGHRSRWAVHGEALLDAILLAVTAGRERSATSSVGCWKLPASPPADLTA